MPIALDTQTKYTKIFNKRPVLFRNHIIWYLFLCSRACTLINAWKVHIVASNVQLVFGTGKMNYLNHIIISKL